MRIRIAIPEEYVSPQVVDAALETVTRLDEDMVRRGASPTSHDLIRQGAVWRPENMGDEHFDHGGTIAARGWGDCDDWAPLHAATLRASGEDPGAFARVVPSGPSTYHAIVQRSDGAIEDPSIAAGMKAHRVGAIDDETIQVWACDPHDGRIYQGSLVPSTSPLSLHCGPTFDVRGAHVVGVGWVYEGRCDVPIQGSPLVHVRSYMRHKPRHKRACGVSVVGCVPYAYSITSTAPHPATALNQAIVGAILCGDAAGAPLVNADRYKLLALQSAMTGMSPGQVREAILQTMTNDVLATAAQSGEHPSVHTADLLAQLDIQPRGIVVGDFFDDLGKAAGSIVSTIADGVNTVAKAVSSVPWGDIIHGIQAAVSVVPILGTGISDVISAAESAYDVAAAALSGNPLKGAIQSAYNFALGTLPGGGAIRIVLDPAVNSLINLTINKEPVDSALLNGILTAVPDQPNIAGVSPRSIAASLAHMIVGHLGVKNTSSGQPPPGPGIASVLQSTMSAAQQAAQLAANKAKIQAGRMAAAQAKRNKASIQAARIKRGQTIQAAKAAAAAAPKPAPHAAIHVLHAAAATPPVVTPPPQPNPIRLPPSPPPASVLPVPPLPRATPAAALPPPGSPGAPPGASHWQCTPGPSGSWQCRWV